MARVVFPSVVVGVGQFGSQVLEDLATQLSHAYGPSAREEIALLAVGLAQQGKALSLPYYSLYEDPGDWLDDPRTIARVLGYTPARIWGLRDYRGLQLNPSRLYETQDRQLARLTFLKHLSRRRTQVETFFQRQARKLLKGTKQSRGHIYVLAALDELEGNALLLDLVATLRGALYHMLQPMQIIVYLAMPTAFSAVETFSPQVLANAFGFLRELEQAQLSHYVPNPYCKQQVLPHPLINFVRLYDSPPQKHAPRPFLRAQWADVLLPLLDDFFGLLFTQNHWANLPSQEQEARGQDETLVFVGTQHVASVMFPRETLHRYWQTHLARTALALHIRHDLDKNVWIETLNRWAQNALPLHDAQDHPTHTPRIFTHIIEWASSSSTSAARSKRTPWKAWLCAEDEGWSGRDVQEKARRYRAHLEWRPSESTIAALRAPNPSPHHLKSAVNKRLAQLFSPLKPETYDITGGQVREALADVAALQTQKSYASLIALARYQIRTLGIVPTFHAFQHIARKLSEFQSAIQVSRNALHHELESNLRQMRHAATHIVDVKRRTLLGTRLSPHTRTYLNAVAAVVEVASEYVALELVAQLAHNLALLTEQIGEQLHSWQHALWQPESPLALYQRLKAREKLLYQALMPAQDGRYQLLSTEWVDSQAKRLCHDYAELLAQQLHWHFVQNDESARPTLEIELYLDEVSLHQLTHKTYPSLNESLLLKAADGMLHDEMKNLTLWDFVLPNKDAVLPEIAHALNQVYTPLDSSVEQGGVHVHYFLDTESSTRVAQQPLLSSLQQEVEKTLNIPLQHAQIGSEAHIMRWTNTDLVPLRETRGYRAAQQSYQNLPALERVRVFAFAREATAAWLENELQRLRWLAPNAQLHPQVGALLGQWSCLQRFVWADALGWLQTRPYQDLNQYALVIPKGDGENAYPIGKPSATLNLCQAVQAFCDALFAKRGKPTGASLVQVDLDEEVERYIRHEAQTHKHEASSKNQEPYWVWAYALKKQKRDWPWALYQALRAQHMSRYYQLQFDRAREQQPGTFQHDLRLTLAYIAHAYAEMYKDAIRQKAR